MQTLAKTYVVKSKKTKDVYIFKYDLDGFLLNWEISNGRLDENKVKYLLLGNRFPHDENKMLLFKKHLKDKFEVEFKEVEITFNLFYEIFNHKTTKKQSQTYWLKNMNEAKRILAVKTIPKYLRYLQYNTWCKQMDPLRWLRNERYLDEWKVS